MIYSVPFSVYERLASAKMNAFEDAINNHTHDGTYGLRIPFSYLDGSISGSQFLPGTVNGNVLMDDSVTYQQIAHNTIQLINIDTTSIHLGTTGYAVYAP